VDVEGQLQLEDVEGRPGLLPDQDPPVMLGGEQVWSCRAPPPMVEKES
jgi:hypothetical protein